MQYLHIRCSVSQNEAVHPVVTSLYLSSGQQGQDLGEQAFELNKINNKHATFETLVQNVIMKTEVCNIFVSMAFSLKQKTTFL